MDNLQERIEEAERLIDASGKQIKMHEPESTKWHRDVIGLKKLIRDMQARINCLKNECVKQTVYLDRIQQLKEENARLRETMECIRIKAKLRRDMHTCNPISI